MIFRSLRSFAQSRRTLRTLDRLATAIEQQTILLERLANRYAPLPIPVTPEDLRTTGPSFSRDEEQGRIQDYVEQCWRDLKRAPTDEEIVDFLNGIPR